MKKGRSTPLFDLSLPAERADQPFARNLRALPRPVSAKPAETAEWATFAGRRKNGAARSSGRAPAAMRRFWGALGASETGQDCILRGPSMEQGRTRAMTDPDRSSAAAKPTAHGKRRRSADANRHGLIAGATGTGKTVTLQILAEGFSAAGVPVFCADVKGDLSGLAVRRRAQATSCTKRAPPTIGLDDYAYADRPGRLLGPVRRAGPSDPHHRLRDGAAAAVPPAGAQRHAGGRAQHRLPARRRRGAAAARPQGPAGACWSMSAERAEELSTELRQCLQGLGRRDPAPPAGAGGAGRRRSSSASRRSTSPT